MHKTWKWSVTGAVLTHTHEEILALCQHAGLAGIEGGTEHFPLQDRQTLDRIAASYGEAGLLIDSFHLPLGRENDIASFYETDRRAAVDGQRHWMECAAILRSREMQQITLGRNSALTLPALNFAGTAAGIDVRQVADQSVLPIINTGIAHKNAGVGQIGAGITHAPMQCFAKAVRWLANNRAAS